MESWHFNLQLHDNMTTAGVHSSGGMVNKKIEAVAENCYTGECRSGNTFNVLLMQYKNRCK